MEGPTVNPSAPRQAEAASTWSPSYELWIAFAVSLIPHALGLLLGGYGHLITNLPLAVGVTIVDVVALVIAYLQFRDDSRASRPSHWLVWATIGAGAVWMIYAVFVGIVLVFGQLFCVSQNCRGPIR
jgi:hypothetical protein